MFLGPDIPFSDISELPMEGRQAAKKSCKRERANYMLENRKSAHSLVNKGWKVKGSPSIVWNSDWGPYDY